MDKCKRGCCWTPHDVCAKQYQCDHHVSAVKQQETVDMMANATAELERTSKWKK